ncbi:TPA: hypothetical protein G9F28_001252 [Salmonella enterica]|nr:hypothetical protein [Salmonella enterica]EEM8924062.1 hypothetical protein [Salmonella enterica]HAF2457728.1 hypothetical protein [Salmonella enterica]
MRNINSCMKIRDINLRMKTSARIQQAIGELHAARLNIAINHCIEAHENLIRADKEIELIKRSFRKLLDS